MGSVVGLSLALNAQVLRVQPWPKSMDSHDVDNRQRPCRMIMRHVKDSLSVCLAWGPSGKLNSEEQLRIVRAHAPPGKEIERLIGIPPVGCCTKSSRGCTMAKHQSAAPFESIAHILIHNMALILKVYYNNKKLVVIRFIFSF
ncbi:hypothetical protein TNCV_4888741 [Trichonephila clavipes]|nr:hypothetical protein TNCV_4888741 [Trichonephila clavipes]